MKTPIPCYCIALPLSNWRSALTLFLFLTLTWGVGALDFVTEGEKYLSLDNPSKALTYLEAALAQGTADERLLLNLGLAYQRVGQANDARKTFRQGADLAGPAQKKFLLNLGISAFLAKDWDTANQAYTEALVVDPVFAEALLNRANTKLISSDLSGAAEDFRAYQTAAPTNPQKEKIDEVLTLLDQAVVDEQAIKLAEESRKKKEEELKQAAAAAAESERLKAEATAEAQRLADVAAAEAERQKQEDILARIRESLAGASGDSKTLSTGPTGAKADDSEASLE